ncbi:SGNH/GDSL hydrolase family protein [Lysinibacter cavernae]|uniref:Lysophospholipase L1-like esterase n=1 Tax=Lysinibacter cavernae TaxID=1640652 RepID=A0A7X5TSL9_9MICO|nr:SGNH/GDSL hydrolase family protein [Lysinibacter cavernae]NIH53185.1 lysophospholipase L1-like esterase [Lysinibacter cavernae]
MAEIKYVALGDSFTEGVGDDLPGGAYPGDRVRGWADLVAEGLARSSTDPVYYANFAIRGRLLGPIIAEQLPPALALAPTIVTFNGGGNDILRPKANLAHLVAQVADVVHQVKQTGSQLVLLSGGNPTKGLPLRGAIEKKGDALNDAVRALAAKNALPFADNWTDHELAGSQYWALDRLHLNEIGHHRVAARVLAAMGVEAPSDWVTRAPAPRAKPGARENAKYYREHVMPWVQRRLTGRSSGDGRVAKYHEWTLISPTPPQE